jgi:hypothetical protein
MRPPPPVLPASAACRLRWSTTGTDGAWPIHVSAAVQTHPNTTSVAKNIFNLASPGRRCPLALASLGSAPRNMNPLHQRRSPNPHSAR